VGVVRFSLGTGSASVGLNVTSHWDHLFPRESNTLGFSGSFVSFHILPFTSCKFQIMLPLPVINVSAEATVPDTNQREHQRTTRDAFLQSNSVASVTSSRLLNSASAHFLSLTLRSNFHISKFYSQSPEYLGCMWRECQGLI